jgi:hypothetical protein
VTFVASRSPALSATFAVAAVVSTAMPARAAAADRQLSDPVTHARWAHVLYREAIRPAPRGSARAVGRLHLYTEDNYPEVYLLLRSHTDARGGEWIQLRVPGRPNGRTGWVRRGALGPLHLTTWRILVDRRRLRMSVFHAGRRRWSAPVGVGRPGTPTPAGRFWIRERIPIRNRGSGYWPFAFGTAAYSRLTDWPGGGVVGIHGPYYAASSIPGRISHGCIRLRQRDDAWLARHIGVGTPLRIR